MSKGYNPSNYVFLVSLMLEKAAVFCICIIPVMQFAKMTTPNCINRTVCSVVGGQVFEDMFCKNNGVKLVAINNHSYIHGLQNPDMT